MALPYNYTPVGYIRATGTQYIDLFYQPKLFGRIKIKFKYYTSGQQRLLGSWQSQYNKSYIVEKSTSNNYSSDVSGVTITSSGTYSLNTNEWYTIDYNINDGYIKINDTTQATLSGEQTGTRAWYLFASNDSEEGSYLKSNAAVEYLQLYDLEGNLVHNFIPCLNDSSAPGLYDDIDGRFYGNEGTGTFTYAPMVNVEVTPTNSGTITGDTYYDPGTDATLTAIPNPGYNFEKWISNRYYLLTAIEGTGTQYIKTNIIPNSNTQIELKFAYTVTSGNGYNRLFGTQVDGVGKTITIRQVNNGNGNIYVEVGNSYEQIAIDTNWHEIIFNNQSNQTVIDGNILFTNPISNSITSGLWIFANNDVTSNFAKAKIEYLKVYNKTTNKYEHILIPVLDYTDLTPGLLDLVEMKFYGNSGTGSFEAYESGSREYVSITDNPLVINNISNSLNFTAQFKKTANCRYKVNGAWKNAMMYIKQNGTWKPGTPKIKINGNWKEGG